MAQRLEFYTASPGAIKAMTGLEQFLAKCGLEQPLVELVRLRASQINGCAYCVDLHAADAAKGGETARRLAALCVWRETPFFSNREKAALEWTEAVTNVSTGHVPDSAWEAASAEFSHQELTDLTLLIITINGWNRFAIAFRKLPA